MKCCRPRQLASDCDRLSTGFLPFVFFSRTKGEWLSHWTLLVRLLIYMVMPVTIVLGFLQSVASLTRENTHERARNIS